MSRFLGKPDGAADAAREGGSPASESLELFHLDAVSHPRRRLKRSQGHASTRRKRGRVSYPDLHLTRAVWPSCNKNETKTRLQEQLKVGHGQARCSRTFLALKSDEEGYYGPSAQCRTRLQQQAINLSNQQDAAVAIGQFVEGAERRGSGQYDVCLCFLPLFFCSPPPPISLAPGPPDTRLPHPLVTLFERDRYCPLPESISASHNTFGRSQKRRHCLTRQNLWACDALVRTAQMAIVNPSIVRSLERENS